MLRAALVLVGALALTGLETATLSRPTPDADTVRDRLDRYLLAYEPQLSTLVAEELLIQRNGPSREAAVHPRADDLAARLRDYLLAYEPRLSELIADEQMEQHDVPEREGRPGAETFAKRTLRSEVAFIALPGGAGWLGFRRVMTVGGKAVAESTGSLGEALPAGPHSDYAKARTMLAESARFNLGAPRTTNLPNLPLELLHPRHAHRFTVRVAGKERVSGKQTTKLVFVESVTPTIIQAVDGGEMRSIVTAWVETVNGRLWRADVITRDTREHAAAFDAVVSVDFREHEALGLLVPTAMTEKFFSDFERRAWGNASYANYRRFQTSGRIVPQF